MDSKHTSTTLYVNIACPYKDCLPSSTSFGKNKPPTTAKHIINDIIALNLSRPGSRHGCHVVGPELLLLLLFRGMVMNWDDAVMR